MQSMYYVGLKRSQENHQLLRAVRSREEFGGEYPAHHREKQKGNANRATLAVARKMVAYLVAVDRRQKDFLVVENGNRTVA